MVFLTGFYPHIDTRSRSVGNIERIFLYLCLRNQNFILFGTDQRRYTEEKSHLIGG